ncbi:MAG: glycosyltransferase family 39 protein [Lewinellaceae bacterium]|nr:glycosyltransferase family 39 protein [Saprospiraceae bacterium]MCB9342325.1 glycosyltransferase family 39 protein [Lewinellaceae bacterium]
MRRDYLLLSGLALLFFLPYLGAVHLFDWDEINFAECAREMIMTGDWMRPQIDFEPFWEKPPLFFWMQGLGMQLFGVNELAARLPNAICGLATILTVYHIGSRLHDRLLGWIWALAWLGSILPHLYFKSGIIDPWFNFFTFVGLYGFIEFRWRFFTHTEGMSFWVKYRHLIVGGSVLGLAILTKGPTAFLIASMVIALYWARYRFKGKGYFKHYVFWAVHAGLAALIWFGVEAMMHGTWFMEEFLKYQVRLFSTHDSGHSGFLAYHFVVLLIGCFPISIFALPNLWGDKQSEDEMLESDTLAACKQSDFGTWMQLLLWVVLILFTVVQTKILHYSSLAYFPLSYLGAVTLWRAIRWKRYHKVIGFALPVIGLLLGTAVLLLPWFGQHVDMIKPLFQQDAFAMANLEANVNWQLWQGLPGLILIIASLAGAFFWFKKQAWKTAQITLLGGTLFTALTMLFIVPDIEAYSQRSAIEFYESKCGENCFVKPVNFKSYAHLFYTCKQNPGKDCTIDDYPSLAHGNPGKSVFFVAKINNLGELPNLPDCHELYRKNGFVFFERKVK